MFNINDIVLIECMITAVGKPPMLCDNQFIDDKGVLRTVECLQNYSRNRYSGSIGKVVGMTETLHSDCPPKKAKYYVIKLNTFNYVCLQEINLIGINLTNKPLSFIKKVAESKDLTDFYTLNNYEKEWLYFDLSQEQRDRLPAISDSGPITLKVEESVKIIDVGYINLLRNKLGDTFNELNITNLQNTDLSHIGDTIGTISIAFENKRGVIKNILRYENNITCYRVFIPDFSCHIFIGEYGLRRTIPINKNIKLFEGV